MLDETKGDQPQPSGGEGRLCSLNHSERDQETSFSPGGKDSLAQVEYPDQWEH